VALQTTPAPGAYDSSATSRTRTPRIGAFSPVMIRVLDARDGVRRQVSVQAVSVDAAPGLTGDVPAGGAAVGDSSACSPARAVGRGRG
jgi:hypothetical protein